MLYYFYFFCLQTVHKNQPIDPLKVGMDVATPFSLSAEKEAEMMSLPIPKPEFQVISDTNQENVPKTNNVSTSQDIFILDNAISRTFTCGNCELIFANQIMMERHVSSVHKGKNDHMKTVHENYQNDSGFASKNEEQSSNEFRIINDKSHAFMNEEKMANHGIMEWKDDTFTEKIKVANDNSNGDEEEISNDNSFELKISSVISLSEQLDSKQNDNFIDDLLLQEETSPSPKEKKFKFEKNISNERHHHSSLKKSKLMLIMPMVMKKKLAMIIVLSLRFHQ